MYKSSRLGFGAWTAFGIVFLYQIFEIYNAGTSIIEATGGEQRITYAKIPVILLASLCLLPIIFLRFNPKTRHYLDSPDFKRFMTVKMPIAFLVFFITLSFMLEVYFSSLGYIRCNDHQIQRDKDLNRQSLTRFSTKYSTIWALDEKECLPWINMRKLRELSKTDKVKN
jgi:hypothetical protein